MRYVVGVAHCGTRAVAHWLRAQGIESELAHLQQHGLRAMDIAERIADGGVVAMRDPILAVLSAANLADDTPSAVIASLEELFSLEWGEVICVDRRTDIPVIGREDNPLRDAYLMGDMGRVQRLFSESQPESLREYDLVTEMRGRPFRARLEALGYRNLAWW